MFRSGTALGERASAVPHQSPEQGSGSPTSSPAAAASAQDPFAAALISVPVPHLVAPRFLSQIISFCTDPILHARASTLLHLPAGGEQHATLAIDDAETTAQLLGLSRHARARPEAGVDAEAAAEVAETPAEPEADDDAEAEAET
ncbi:hypothetical protein DCS_06382 [Drechmeria coniospora]|uniref:Uncharacterized protein n=1 Tax=Drechmeria coniospora TaxID=98403 RepID=A0A151GBK0_DRECN|nr:hypothetical protein DCS_06382 [Drechmeria coniospora]KYK54424.1 hypothetical protein DCS_06382 [Drechmeria coniospora]